jgi:hypothetical protein
VAVLPTEKESGEGKIKVYKAKEGKIRIKEGICKYKKGNREGKRDIFNHDLVHA